MKIEDWKNLKVLLHSGYPLLDALQIMGKDICKISMLLEEGQTIEKIMIKNQKGRFYDHLNFFIQVGSFEHAIDSALHFYLFEKELKTKWIKQTAYPLFIFVSAYSLLLVFTSYLVPMMLEVFQQNERFFYFIFVSKIIQLICIGILICSFLIFLIICYLLRHQQELMFLISHNRKSATIASLFTSFLFAAYLLELIKQGVSTYTALHYLEKVSKNTIFSLLQNNIMNQLEQGVDLLTAIEQEDLIHEECKQSFRIGMTTNSLQHMLQMYLKRQEFEWERRLKKSAIVIQCISYIFVGIVVLLVYQIMLIPLSMLEQM